MHIHAARQRLFSMNERHSLNILNFIFKFIIADAKSSKPELDFAFCQKEKNKRNLPTFEILIFVEI